MWLEWLLHLFLFRRKNPSVVEDVAVSPDLTDFSLAKILSNMDGWLNDGDAGDQLADDVMPSAGEEMGSGEKGELT